MNVQSQSQKCKASKTDVVILPGDGTASQGRSADSDGPWQWLRLQGIGGGLVKRRPLNPAQDLEWTHSHLRDSGLAQPRLMCKVAVGDKVRPLPQECSEFPGVGVSDSPPATVEPEIHRRDPRLAGFDSAREAHSEVAEAMEGRARSTGPMVGTLDMLIRNASSQKRWKVILAPYERPDDRRSLLQLAVTLALYGAVWAILLQTVQVGYLLTAIVALPAAGLMVRLIIIQHDCGHGSYFTSRRVCNAVGRILSLPVLTPHDYMKRIHAAHHAHSGNLDRRLGGDIPTLTVAEYRALGWWGRLTYRLQRNPWVMMGVLFPAQFLFVNRFPAPAPRSWAREWRSVWWTNAAISAVLAGVWVAGGAGLVVQVVLIQSLIVLYAGAFSGVITHAQHQFEDAYWRRSGEWDYFDAGLRGSSWLALPKPLQWLTASIGLHHVHHLSTRIPNYRLQHCHDENPTLWSAQRITLWQAFKALNLALFDERRDKLISFGEYRRAYGGPAE